MLRFFPHFPLALASPAHGAGMSHVGLDDGQLGEAKVKTFLCFLVSMTVCASVYAFRI